jgi:hypothetical protein
MVKKSTLLKKLSSYSALASVAIVAAKNADGQVVYTAINPPKVLVIDSVYYLDLNNDGTIDYVIELPPQFKTSKTTSSAVYAFMKSENANYIEADTIVKFSSSALLKANNYKSVIGGGKSNVWESEGELDYYTLKGHKKTGNNFGGKGDKYIGLQLKKAGKLYYGWVRVNLHFNCDTLIIKDYAYNATADSSIKAGQGQTTGIAPATSESAILEDNNPNPATSISNFIFSVPVYTRVTVTLYDVMGRKIETLLNNAMQQPGQHNIPVDVSNLSNGIYFYELTVNGQAYTQKLVVAH